MTISVPDAGHAAKQAPKIAKDFQEHLAALELRGLVVRVERPINKDTELHPLARWQFQGALAESQAPRLPVHQCGRQRRQEIRHAGGRGRARRFAGDLRPRHGGRARRYRPGLAARDPESHSAGHGEIGRLPGGGDHGRRVACARRRPRRFAGADFDAGLRCRALSHRDHLHHQGPGDRRAQYGHLSRPAEGDRPARRAHGLAARRCGRLSALAEISEARAAHAGRHRDRLRAGDLLHRPAKARRGFRRDGRRGRIAGRTDQNGALHHQRSRSAGGFRNRHRRPDRFAIAGARRPVRRIPRPCRARRLQHVDAGDRDHHEEEARLRLHHQPGDAVRIHRDQGGRLRTAVPGAFARPSGGQRESSASSCTSR